MTHKPHALLLLVLVLLLPAMAAAQPSQSAWTPAGELSRFQYGHSATLLKDGTVLVAGVGRSADVYDPATRSWQATGLMLEERRGHTATLLPDGRVLVAGGTWAEFGRPFTAELYTPGGGWTTTGEMRVARSSHSASALPDGRVLVAGGASFVYGALDAVEIYDPATGRWSLGPKLATRRLAHSATTLRDGRILLAGGYDGQDTIDTLEIYDPASGAWTTGAPLPEPRAGHSATLLNDGRVLVAGGYQGPRPLATAAIYDPTANTWQTVPDMVTPRHSHTATLLPDGRVLIAGGRKAVEFGAVGEFQASMLDAAEVFDPASMSWATVDPMSIPRFSHSDTLLPDGTVLIAGGFSLPRDADAVGQATTATEIFDPAKAAFTPVATTASPPSSGGTPPARTAKASDGLVQPEDVPDGWLIDAPSGGLNTIFTVLNPFQCLPIDQEVLRVSDPAERERTRASAELLRPEVEEAPTVLEFLYALPAGVVDEAMRSFGCAARQEGDFRYTYSDFAVPALGADGQHALTAEVRWQDGGDERFIRARLLYVRRGETLALFVTLITSQTPRLRLEASDEALVNIARRAVQRLGELDRR